MPDELVRFAPTDIDPSAISDIDLRDSAGGPYGLGPQGFVPKPYARLVSEGLARAQQFFGDDIDVRPGSVIRRLIEMSALEHARSHATLALMYDQIFVSSAVGDALSRLGEELGLARPELQAEGEIGLTLAAPAPGGEFVVPTGARLLTPGGHHVGLLESARFAEQRKSTRVRVQAFYPGAGHNLDPLVADQKITLWNPADPALDSLRALAGDNAMTAEQALAIAHDAKLTGGELLWPDGRYRELLLRAPRSLWTVEALRTAVTLVPGVEEAQVIDEFGGLDLERSIFGNFNFIERLFAGARDLGSPYSFAVIVKSAPSAIWGGADGLRAAIAETLEDLRPIGVFPEIRMAEEVGVGIAAKLVLRGEPLPAGDSASVNASAAADEFKDRLIERVRGYVRGLRLGEPVRVAQVNWAMLNEPGLEDVLDLRLARALPSTTTLDFNASITAAKVRDATLLEEGENLTLTRDQVAVFLDDPSGLVIL